MQSFLLVPRSGKAASPDDALHRLEKDEANSLATSTWFKTALMRLLAMRNYY
jgi:hypothetical protein